MREDRLDAFGGGWQTYAQIAESRAHTHARTVCEPWWRRGRTFKGMRTKKGARQAEVTARVRRWARM